MHLKSTKKTALIDTELVLYKCAAKAESGGTGIDRLTQMCMMALDNIVSGCKASNYYYVVSGRDNFRKTLYDDYKAGRPPKPPLYNQLCENIKEYAGKRWVFHPQLEADDAILLAATSGKVQNPIVCTIDKDLLTCEGWTYNWNKDDFPHYTSKEEAEYNWLKQLLMGDSVDGIEGMKGIGEVKAKALIEKHGATGLRKHHTIPEIAEIIYIEEGFSIDQYRKCLYLATIWSNPFPAELMENDLIREITKTIPSIQA